VKIQGTVRDLESVHRDSGPAQRFWIVTADGRNLQVYDSKNTTISVGQVVDVIGDFDSEGTLQAERVKLPTAPASKRWIWIVGLVSAAVLVIFLIIPRGGAPRTAADAKKLICRGSANPSDMTVTFTTTGPGSASTLSLSFKKANKALDLLQPGECAWDGAQFSGSDPAVLSQEVQPFGSAGAPTLSADIVRGVVTRFTLPGRSELRWPQVMTNGVAIWAFTAYRDADTLKVLQAEPWPLRVRK
jgi:hypothetical protein